MTAKSKILAKNLVKKLAIVLAPFEYMLQVILILGLIHFQTGSVCFNQGQLVSTQVSLGQVQNTGHRSLFYQYRNNPNHLQVLTSGLKAFVWAYLGLRLALTNV